jgi:hypothetical protein
MTRGFFQTRDHSGCHYTEFISRLHQCLRPKTYFEIGTLVGDTLALSNSRSIAVDPEFKVERNIIGEKSVCLLFQMTSDNFFAQHDPQALLGSPIDLAFLDGMHWFEFLLRDFTNTEIRCKKNSIILLHDCLPTDSFVARRNAADTSQLHLTSHQEWWAGDVWKSVVIIKKYRPDLKIHCFDASPTGLVAITNLSPTSDVLGRSYFEAISEFKEASEYNTLKNFFDSLSILHTENFVTPEALANLFWI